MAVLATALCIVGLAFLDDLPIGNDSETTREIVRYILITFAVFGVLGTVRSIVQSTKKRVALRVDAAGVTTTAQAFGNKASKRKTRTTAWSSIDALVVESRRTGPNAGETYLRVCRDSGSGELVDVARRHKVSGHKLSWDELRDTAKHYSPGVRLEERYTDGSDVRIDRSEQ